MSLAPEIDEAAAMQLAEMGFPLEACRKAVYYTGNMGPEMAFNWIIAHMEEPGKMTVFNGTHVWREKGVHHLNQWICSKVIVLTSRKTNESLRPLSTRFRLSLFTI